MGQVGRGLGERLVGGLLQDGEEIPGGSSGIQGHPAGLGGSGGQGRWDEVQEKGWREASHRMVRGSRGIWRDQVGWAGGSGDGGAGVGGGKDGILGRGILGIWGGITGILWRISRILGRDQQKFGEGNFGVGSHGFGRGIPGSGGSIPRIQGLTPADPQDLVGHS